MWCMMGNVGIERRGRWDMESSTDRRVSESSLKPGKGAEQGRRGPFVFRSG